MSPATTQNTPAYLKARYSNWPVYRVSFEELLRAIAGCPEGEVLVGRFSPPLHTAYLADAGQNRLLRCVQDQPMRVQLRRHLATSPTVKLVPSEVAA